MKRLLFVVFFPLCALGLCAQNWVVTEEKADGADTYTSYDYVNTTGMVTLYGGDLSLLMFDRLDGTLAAEPCTIFGFGKKGYSVKAVLYDNCGNLLNSYDLWLWKLDTLKAGGETRSQKGTIKKIISHLKDQRGRVVLFFPKSNFAFFIEPMTV